MKILESLRFDFQQNSWQFESRKYKFWSIIWYSYTDFHGNQDFYMITEVCEINVINMLALPMIFSIFVSKLICSDLLYCNCMGHILTMVRACPETHFTDFLWESFSEWFVAGGLAEEVDEKTLHAAFIPFGDILDIQIPLDYETGKIGG